jgi:hypothetical protein
LLLVPGEHGQHRRAGEIEHEVQPRVLVRPVELRSGVREEEYQEGAGNLDCLSSASVAGRYATLTTIFP